MNDAECEQYDGLNERAQFEETMHQKSKELMQSVATSLEKRGLILSPDVGLQFSSYLSTLELMFNDYTVAEVATSITVDELQRIIMQHGFSLKTSPQMTRDILQELRSQTYLTDFEPYSIQTNVAGIHERKGQLAVYILDARDYPMDSLEYDPKENQWESKKHHFIVQNNVDGLQQVYSDSSIFNKRKEGYYERNRNV
ncbi:hypothetical protein [Listeria goaensis]|uniref:hypothetical protein n=1 Tax=Listeria goaensis TaxID=1649188 RepID=UPI0013563D4F|nr:hypothetical protein [Listeria goaensis]